MPKGDGTGPMGMGPMTGRAAGFCAGFETPGYANPTLGGIPGMGFGRGRGFGGRGRGWRHRFYATGLPGWMRAGGYIQPRPNIDRNMEKQALQSQAEALQLELDSIQKRLSAIENHEKSE